MTDTSEITTLRAELAKSKAEIDMLKAELTMFRAVKAAKEYKIFAEKYREAMVNTHMLDNLSADSELVELILEAKGKTSVAEMPFEFFVENLSYLRNLTGWQFAGGEIGYTECYEQIAEILEVSERDVSNTFKDYIDELAFDF
jgi:DNA-directed RNA polymerase specialized sigma subunit